MDSDCRQRCYGNNGAELDLHGYVDKVMVAKPGMGGVEWHDTGLIANYVYPSGGPTPRPHHEPGGVGVVEPPNGHQPWADNGVIPATASTSARTAARRPLRRCTDVVSLAMPRVSRSSRFAA